MAQHFLLSIAARGLSLASVARMSEEEARALFQRIRWADNGGEPFCPKCGCLKAYGYKTRALWRCQACRHQFSVTSDTIFASRKLPVRDYLLAIAIFVNGAKGHSALQLSRDLDCQYRTAFVLSHKLREALAAETKGHKVGGIGKTVEVDGMYAGGHIRPANFKKDRRDRRFAVNQNGKRRAVVIMRERNGRTLPFVFRSEDQAVPMIRATVAIGSTLHADEAAHWDALHGHVDMKRINHSLAYSDGEACTNQAESFFSRLRRAEIGTHHHIAGPYLNAYAAEMAWREDYRRMSNGDQYLLAADAAAQHPKSRQWCGYWNRSKP